MESPRARCPKATHSVEQRSDCTGRTLVSIQSLDMRYDESQKPRTTASPLTFDEK